MAIDIRPEQPGDEAQLDVLNYRAFEAWHREHAPQQIPHLGEADLVRLLRAYCPTFDRRFSIVGTAGGEVVAHAVFTPCDIRLMGETVRALGVGPVAVLPERQRQGLGGELLAYGHDLGAAEGFALTFLVGHPTYYPRHGYVACHGFASMQIDAGKLPQPTRSFTLMPVTPADGPWLAEMGRREWDDVDFAWLWGEAPTEWHAPGMIAHVWLDEDSKRVAYSQANPWRKWRYVLAEDPDVAREVIATIRPESLDHHPSGNLARMLANEPWCEASVRPSDAAMARALQPGALDAVIAANESGERTCGTVNWPLPFALIP